MSSLADVAEMYGKLIDIGSWSKDSIVAKYVLRDRNLGDNISLLPIRWATFVVMNDICLAGWLVY